MPVDMQSPISLVKQGLRRPGILIAIGGLIPVTVLMVFFYLQAIGYARSSLEEELAVAALIRSPAKTQSGRQVFDRFTLFIRVLRASFPARPVQRPEL